MARESARQAPASDDARQGNQARGVIRCCSRWWAQHARPDGTASLASASGSPVERSGRGGDRDVPAESPEPLFKVRRLVGDFNDPVGGSVIKPPADGGGRGAVYEFIGSAVCVVGEEHAAIFLQAVSHQCPERLKAFE